MTSHCKKGIRNIFIIALKEKSELAKIVIGRSKFDQKY